MPDFDDPFKSPELTVVRPRPGAGRRNADGEPARAPRPAPPMHEEPGATGVLAGVGSGLNPLARAATPILLLAAELRRVVALPDVPSLRLRALDGVRRFEERARRDGVSPEVARAARYVVCAAVDEAVMSTPWGSQSGWAQRTLLVELHQEAFGGEKFFQLLERLSADPAANIDFIEVQYLCLAIGFSGKYLDSDRDRTQLADIRRRTYALILAERGAPEPALSLRWRGVEDRRNPIMRYVPWWVFAATAAAAVVVVFAVLTTRLNGQAAPVKAALASISGSERPAAVPPSAVRPGPTIRSLLADDEARQVVRIEEFGGETWITPLGELFASGSARLNPGAQATMQRIAAALEQIPGRVSVNGHTDDQPIRSGQFADNYELSRERASAVAQALSAAGARSTRFLLNGFGADKPLRPGSDARDRAVNRRVEIVHTRQS